MLGECLTCLFFFPDPDFDATDLGKCKRYPPYINGFPPILATETCGEHRVDRESKKRERSR